MFNHVAVFGLGLLGGSLCRCLRRNVPAITLSAWGRDVSRLIPARDDGTVDHIGSLDRMDLTGVDLAVVCVPVRVSLDIIAAILDHPSLGPGALVIDVGSVKAPVVDAARQRQRADRFIGCHPMAGSEQMGYAASSAGLYRDSSVIITPHAGNQRVDIERVSALWRLAGARVHEADPRVHDLAVAHSSHLPHVAAAAVARVYGRFSSTLPVEIDPGAFIGNGFRDTTRIAAGSPDMWDDIAHLNRESIAAALRAMMDDLGEFLSALDRGDAAVREFFAHAKIAKETLR